MNVHPALSPPSPQASKSAQYEALLHAAHAGILVVAVSSSRHRIQNALVELNADMVHGRRG